MSQTVQQVESQASVKQDLDHISPGLRHLAIPIDDIAPDTNNAMGHDEANIAEIARSLDRFGQRKPLVGNRRTGQTEAGAGTWLAAKRLGWRYIAVSWEDDDPEIAAQFGVADNATPSDDWNMERLQAIWESSGGDVPGLDEARLKELWQASGQANGKEPKDPKPQIDRAAELQEVWGTALGQVWQLGEHRLVIGDCTDKVVVEAVMRGERAACTVTDPPFNVRDDEWDKFDDFLEFTCKWLRSAKQYSGIIASFFADKFLPLLPKAAEIEGLPFRRSLIWVKPPGSQFAGGQKDGYWFDFELIQVYGKSEFEYDGPTRFSVFDYRTITGQEHGAEKPPDLYADIWRNYSKDGEIVFEPFNGTGSNLVACENLNRKGRGIELNPGYAAVTIQRLAEMGLEPVLL